MSSENRAAERESRVRTIRLEDAALHKLLDDLDRADPPPPDKAPRRYSYRIPALRLQLQQPGGSVFVAHTAPTRWISENALGFLHGCYVHRGIGWRAQLITLFGTWENVAGTVQQCRYIAGHVHEVEVAFTSVIDVSLFCSQAVSRRVLLAEDQPMMAQLATYHLTQLNARVDHAADGQAAIEMALKTPYDLVLMDIDMPLVDGFEAMTVLRSKGYSAPIAAFCPVENAAEQGRWLTAGFDFVVAKPLSRDALSQVFDSLRDEALYSAHQQDESMHELISAFVANLPDAIQALEQAFGQDDRNEFQHEVRMLREQGTSYGFEPITEAAAAIETQLLAGQSPAALRDELNRLVKFCRLARVR